MPAHDWNLVDAGIFHHFHNTWIPDIMRTLIDGRLPSDYYAMIEQVASGTIPDVLTLQRHGGTSQNGQHPTPESVDGTVALAEAPPRASHRARSLRDPYAARARSVVVRHSDDDRVVAVIEIVSPGNKNSRDALRTFVEKAVGLLRAGVHLLIVDLFPPGPHDPHGLHSAIWTQFDEDDFTPPDRQPLTFMSYVGGDCREAFIQVAGVGDVLPECALFLRDDRYINLPLESSYTSAYATVPARWRQVLESRP